MRLEVFCEDRLGLTRELLDLLVLRSIDLRGIEIDPVGRIYLNFAEIEFNTFSSLMAEIRRIAGVTDVRTIPWMPSEREHLALSALLVGLNTATAGIFSFTALAINSSMRTAPSSRENSVWTWRWTKRGVLMPDHCGDRAG